MSAKVQYANDERVPMPLRRRWYIFRRQFLPGLAFTCLVVCTLFFWKTYLLPVEQPQGGFVSQQAGVDSHATKAAAHKAVVSGSMGFINK